MEKVNFTFKRNGNTRIMPKRHAELLQSLGHGRYMTRDMVASRGPVLPSSQEVPQLSASQPPVVMAEADELDALDKDQLHALAKERDVKVHHLAGADKVRAALREAA